MFQDYKFEFEFAQGIRLGSKPLFHMNLEQPNVGGRNHWWWL
jgi:hypothetical protein